MTARSDPAKLAEIRRQLEVMQQQIDREPADAGMVPLKIQCGMSSCANGRHCLNHLRKPGRGIPAVAPGQCRDCGATVVALPEPDGRQYGDPDEIVQTIVATQSELIRAHYWHVPIDQWAMNQARRLGRRELHIRVEAAVVKALVDPTEFSGRQVPYDKQIVAYAQHATATCCRKCAAYWHGLPAHDRPSSAQLRHSVTIAQAFVDLRLPDLPDEPEPRSSVGTISSASGLTAQQTRDEDSRLVELIAAGSDPAGLLRPDKSGLNLLAAHNTDGGFVRPRLSEASDRPHPEGRRHARH